MQEEHTQDGAVADTGAPGAEAGAAPETAAETVPGPEALLRQAELAAQEHHDAWLRARAELDNARKRFQSELAQARKFAVEGFAELLLPVRDSLEAALAAQTTTVDNLRQGVELTLRQLQSAFERSSVSEVAPAGEKFDPHRHQAISAVDSELPPNTVVQVLQKGYLLHDRVLRPALVTVSRSKDSA